MKYRIQFLQAQFSDMIAEEEQNTSIVDLIATL